MNEGKLFAAIRGIDNKPLLQLQVDGVHAILDRCTKHGVTDIHKIAYILATAYHESRFKPVEENGKGAGRDYGKKLKMGEVPGKRIPYTTPDKLYYGRGMVQLTWYENYQQFGHLLNVDLLNRPELAMQVDYAAEIIVIGMVKGLFTGVGLSKYFNDKLADSINARKIINGTDQAALISGYYKTILNSII